MNTHNSHAIKTKWYNKMPHTFIILFAIIVFATILTWIIPPGTFDREVVEGTNRLVIVPGTFHEAEKNPTGIFEMFTAIAKGLQASSNIIFMIFLSSGAFKVINATGALENSIGVMIRKVNCSNVSPSLVVAMITFLFSCLGLVVGPEIQIPFTIIGVSIALGLGYDLVVGLAMVAVGGGIGFALGPICASTVGTSHAIAGLPLFSGILLRTACWFTGTLASIGVILWYGNKVKRNPEKSLVKDVPTDGLGLSKTFKDYNVTQNDKFVLLVLGALFLSLIIGPTRFGWYLDEMMTVFVIAAIIVAAIAKFSVNQAIDIFVKGAGEMFGVAMMVGLGRSIQVILENSNILDSIILGLSQPLSELGSYSAAIIMTLIHGVINFFIPSGSGQAAATMPIMFPLGEVVGLTNQVSVMAFQIGDGITNIIYPTLGSLMAMCGIARVPYGKWFKFAIKVVLAIYLVTWAFLLFAVKINWGPF